MDEEEKKKKKPAHNTENTIDEGSWIGTGTSKASISANPVAKSSPLDYGTYKDDLDRLTEAQKKYQVAELKKARDKALQNLDVQEQSIKPTYQNARNLTSASSKQGARSFAEYMANRGLTNSGAAAQGEISRQSALQNNLGNINTAEANAFRDIANQRTQVNNDYASGVASANAAIQQQYLNNLLNYNEQQRQYINGLKERALGQYANDYQAYMNTLDPNSLEYLQVGAKKGDKVLGYAANAYTPQNATARIQSGNFTINDALAAGFNSYEDAKAYSDQYQAAKQAEAEAAAEQLAYNRSQDAFNNYIKEKNLENDIAYNNARIANTRASTANYYDQINKRGTTSSNELISYSNHNDVINNNFKSTDEFGDTVTDTQGIANYITQELSAGAISSKDARTLSNKYGLDYYTLTPEYQQIMYDMGQTVTKDQGLEILAGYMRLNPDVDQNIYKRLYEDWEEAYK